MVKINKINVILIALALVASSFGFSASAQTAPTVTTGAAVLSSQYLVNVYGTVNPNGNFTYVWAEYGTTSSLGTPYGRQSVGSGTSTVEIRVWIPRLQPNTTYYYRIVAQAGGTVVNGETKSFSTGGTSGSGSGSTVTPTPTPGSNNSSGAPSVATNGPASVSSNSAVINGSVNPNNTNTTFWFEFGTSQSTLNQTTTVQSAGSGNTWQLVTGNLSGLETGRTYYYRVAAQNSYGVNRGDVVSFTTGASQTGGTGQPGSTNQSNGQVLGTASSNGTAIGGTSNGSSGISTSGSSRSTSTATTTVKKQINSRPSFISLEYSLNDGGALVLVADNIKPKPGEDFTYTINYKNDTPNTYNGAKLKVIVPSDAYYVSSNIEPVIISGNIAEFNLGNIEPGGQGGVVVVVKIRENVAPGTNMIFTSVLTYKDKFGTQLATTSYLTVRAGQGDGALSASFLGSFGSSGLLWLVALGLVILMGILTYGLVKIRRKNGNGGKENGFELSSVPATFEPVPPVPMNRPSFAEALAGKPNFIEAPMGRSDIFQPVK